MDMIELRAFRAPEQPELCKEFQKEHQKVLEDFGITKVLNYSSAWPNDPDCIVIVALHPDLGMVGGIRLQRSHENDLLPMERSLRTMAPGIVDEIAELRRFGVGEVCGLWNANRYSGKGVPVLLSQAITAVSLPAGMKRMVCLVAHYTEKHPRNNGFIRMTDLGQQGTFPKYPIPSHTAVAMVNPDTVLLPFASLGHRKLLMSLRLRPEQVRLETPTSQPIEVRYALRLRKGLVTWDEYASVEADHLRFTA